MWLTLLSLFHCALFIIHLSIQIGLVKKLQKHIYKELLKPYTVTVFGTIIK